MSCGYAMGDGGSRTGIAWCGLDLSLLTLPKACLNVRSDFITNVGLAEGPRGANRCRDCDAYRLRCIGSKNGF